MIPKPNYPKFNDLEGKTFGRYKVIEYFGSKIYSCGKTHQKWLCKCECGNEREVFAQTLLNGQAQSCGCLNRENIIKSCTTHGMYKSSEWQCWKNMKIRCKDPNNKNYGGRGIYVCDRWLESFENFYEDMGDKPSKSHSIDRINNDKGYSKDNCKWVLISSQNRNKRDTHMITFNGETMCAADWSRRLGGNKYMVQMRLKNGWTLEEALTTPKI